MKAVQIKSRGEAEIVTVEKPRPLAGQVLVRPLTLSLCASDIFFYKYMPDEYYPLPPGTSGHEMIGVVEEINGETAEFAVGDHVLALAPEQGAMAEYYVAQLENVLPIPAGVPHEQLVQAQQLGTVMYAAKQLPNMMGKDVAVVGQGSAGLWWNFLLRRMGAKTIVGIDVQAHRLVLGGRYGATHTIHNKTADAETELRKIFDGELPEFVIEAAGEIDSINLAIDLAGDDGYVLQFGVPHAEQFTFNYYTMFRKCLTVKSIVFANREQRHLSTRRALEMIANGEIDVAPIITHRFPFAQVKEAYDLHYARDEGAVKIIVEMPETPSE